MKYNRCGESGVLLPEVSLGFWHNFGRHTPYERSRDIALRAFEKGVTHFDLANNYGPEPGDAEARLGRMLREDLKSHRDELFISTKAAYDMWDGPYGIWASRKHLMASLDQSLQRMGLEYVDLFYCHRYDPETPLIETLQTLVDIVKQGKALYIGLSRWPLHALRFALRYMSERDVPVLIYQGKLNMLDREPVKEGILDELLSHQIPCNDEPIWGMEKIASNDLVMTPLTDSHLTPRPGFISFSPLAQGLLTDRYLNGIPEGSRMTEEHFLKSSVLTSEMLKKLMALNEMAKERGESLAQMALAWILHYEAVTSVLIGASSVEQLETNLKCIESAPFSDEELTRIDQILD